MTPNVFIATPMYGGMCHGSYTASLVWTLPVFINAGVPLQFGYVANESLVTRARDRLANDFLETGCTHLMFIDSDIGFRGEDILSMVDADKDVIFGLYFRKEIDWSRVAAAVRDGLPVELLPSSIGGRVVNTFPGEPVIEDVPVGEPVEVVNGGTGFMLIKRAVFEELALTVPMYRHGEGYHSQFFDTVVQCDVLLSEDFAFCRAVRDLGFKVWAAPWVELTHTGQYRFGDASREGRQ